MPARQKGRRRYRNPADYAVDHSRLQAERAPHPGVTIHANRPGREEDLKGPVRGEDHVGLLCFHVEGLNALFRSRGPRLVRPQPWHDARLVGGAKLLHGVIAHPPATSSVGIKGEPAPVAGPRGAHTQDQRIVEHAAQTQVHVGREPDIPLWIEYGRRLLRVGSGVLWIGRIHDSGVQAGHPQQSGRHGQSAQAQALTAGHEHERQRAAEQHRDAQPRPEPHERPPGGVLAVGLHGHQCDPGGQRERDKQQAERRLPRVDSAHRHEHDRAGQRVLEVFAGRQIKTVQDLQPEK